MHETTWFIIEAIIVLSLSILLFLATLRQVHHDFMQTERWRPLIVCHYVIAIAAGFQVVNAIDPQAGLGAFSQSFTFFLRNMKTMLLIASGRALAAAFVGSYEVIVSNGVARPRNIRALIVHAIFFVLAAPIFVALFATRLLWLGVVAEILILMYTVLVGVQIIGSAHKVRTLLGDRYKTAIQKLTRVIVLTSILLIVGVLFLFIMIAVVVDAAMTSSEFPENHLPFDYSYLVIHFSSLGAIVAVLIGSWKISEVGSTTNTTSNEKKKKSGPPSVDRSLSSRAPISPKDKQQAMPPESV